MARWEVRTPTVAPDGTRGFQMFVYSLTLHNEANARSRALAEVTSNTAVRHRRGAAADTTALDITLRQASLI